MLLSIRGFRGCALKPSRYSLPDSIGVDSQNLRPDLDDFVPWRLPVNVATAPAGTNTIYRMSRSQALVTNHWLVFASDDVDAMPGFLGSDTSERTYFTGGGAPRWTDNLFGLTAPPYPTQTRPLGMPAPINAPTLSIVAAGTGSAETRYYLTTWVSDKGEESMPSPVSAQLTCNSGATVRVTRVAAVPGDGRVYSTWRIYRTQANAAGTADFYFVAERPVANTTYDEAPGTSLAETLKSLTWAMPDANLRGLTALWNGMAAAFVGKRLCFCEPYRAFAWPTNYELATKDNIVGLAVWRQNLVVLTTGQNYIVTGGHPSSMTMVPMDFKQPCVSKRSIVEMGDRVVWASPFGLVSIGDQGPMVLTEMALNQDQWNALVPTTIRASRHHSRLYVASYTASGTDRGFVVDMANPGPVHFLSAGYAALHWDDLQGRLFVLSGTNIAAWDSGAAMTGSFTSKVYRLPKPERFRWAQVVADTYPASVTVYAGGGTLLLSRSVPDGKPFRLPSSNRHYDWQVRTQGATRQVSVLLAGTIQEIQEAA